MTRRRASGAAPSRWVNFLAMGFGAGAAPVAPGTFGTLMGVAIYLGLREFPLPAYVATVVLMFAAGVWICGRAERDLRRHDHPAIVWDEITAFQVTMFAAPPGAGWVIYGFVLFRVLDITKPWPIRAIERRVHGGMGTMLDDLLAGGCALAVLQLSYWIMSVS